jgi:hypothetical protein
VAVVAPVPVTASVIAVVTGVALGADLATVLPYTLAGVSSDRAGLTTGLYVAGAMAGSQLARWLWPH